WNPTLYLALIDTTAGEAAAVHRLKAFTEVVFVPGRPELIHSLTGEDADLAVYNLETRKQRTRGKAGWVRCLTAAPDGRTVYAGILGPDRGQYGVDRIDPETLAVRDRFITSKDVVNRMALSADGRVLVT